MHIAIVDSICIIHDDMTTDGCSMLLPLSSSLSAFPPPSVLLHPVPFSILLAKPISVKETAKEAAQEHEEQMSGCYNTYREYLQMDEDGG